MLKSWRWWVIHLDHRSHRLISTHGVVQTPPVQRRQLWHLNPLLPLICMSLTTSFFFFLKNKRTEWDHTCTRYRAVSATKSIPRGRSFPLTLPPTSCLFSSNWQKNRETNKNWQHATVLLPTLEVWGNQSSSLKHFRKRKKSDCISSSDFPVCCCTSELHH